MNNNPFVAFFAFLVRESGLDHLVPVENESVESFQRKVEQYRQHLEKSDGR